MEDYILSADVELGGGGGGGAASTSVVRAAGGSDDASQPGVAAQLLAFIRVFLLLWTRPFQALLKNKAPPPALVGPAADEEQPRPRSPDLPPSPGTELPPASRTPVRTPEPLWPASAAPPEATAEEGVDGRGVELEVVWETRNRVESGDPMAFGRQIVGAMIRITP